METEARWESRVSTGTADAILSILRRLPSIWSTRRKARRIAGRSTGYTGHLEVPDADTIYSWIEGICATPHRRPGTPEGLQAERWVEDALKAVGLEQVTVEPVPIKVWTPYRWSLTVDGRTVPSFFVPNTGFSGPRGVQGELVYVGKGRPRDIERVDVSGKIVVAEVTFPLMPTGLALKYLKAAYYISDTDSSISIASRQYLNFVRQNFVGGAPNARAAPRNDVYWQASERGALGICLILRDQPGGTDSHYGPYDGIMKPTPALWIGKYEGKALAEAAKAGRVATVVLEGEEGDGFMHNIYGVLPGKSEEVIMITSHHDSPFRGATEDGAGVAQVLAQASAWSGVPREERPRTLVFVIDSGHFYGSLGGHSFARQHPDIMERTRLLLTLEHLGAKEVRGHEGGYEETGKLAQTVMFATPDPRVVGLAIDALEEKPAKVTAVIPSDLIAPVPTSDASGYVVESQVDVISWIGCPYYLLDEHDTLDKIEKNELRPIAQTVSELVRGAMYLR